MAAEEVHENKALEPFMAFVIYEEMVYQGFDELDWPEEERVWYGYQISLAALAELHGTPGVPPQVIAAAHAGASGDWLALFRAQKVGQA